MKKVIIVLLGLAMTVSLLACGNSKAPAPSESTATASSQTTEAASTQPVAPAEASSATEAESEQPAPEADVEVFNLIASFHSPETNSSVIYTKAWCEEITEASGGRIQWTYYTSGSLTTSSETFTHARDGVCDVGWTTPVLVGAPMVANSLMSIPFVGWPINEDAGEIAWNCFEQSEALQKEWEGVKVISYYPMGANIIALSNEPIVDGSELKGKNIRATNAVNSAFLEYFGANPTIVSTSDVYENLQKNVVTGSLIDWNLYNSFHLFDVMKYAVQDTLYTNVGNIVMNLNTYNSLPEDLQKIIDEHSGIYASKMGARMTEEMDEEFMQECIKNGVTVTPADETLKTELSKAGAAAVDEWIKECDESGIDSKALIDLFVGEMGKLGYTCPVF